MKKLIVSLALLSALVFAGSLFAGVDLHSASHDVQPMAGPGGAGGTGGQYR